MEQQDADAVSAHTRDVDTDVHLEDLMSPQDLAQQELARFGFARTQQLLARLGFSKRNIIWLITLITLWITLSTWTPLWDGLCGRLCTNSTA